MGFPEKFLWGTATASYQVEGGFEDGRGYTVWDDFCATPGKVMDGSDGSMACDHYHRYKEDIRLFAEMVVQNFAGGNRRGQRGRPAVL